MVANMTTFIRTVLAILVVSGFTACQWPSSKKSTQMEDFLYQTEQFADIRILRYPIPGFDDLELNQKMLVYYLHEAAMAGRDILWDQHYRHNLTIRKTIEEIIKTYNGDRNTPEFKEFIVYAKRVFVANGIHHHYSTEKILPGFSEEYFIELINNSPDGNFPIRDTENINSLIMALVPVMFDPAVDAKRVNTSPGRDMALHSANNFYEGVSQQEVLDFYKAMHDPEDPRPLSHGLNSKLIKREGQLTEVVWKVNGMYSQALVQIVSWLEKALSVAENSAQRAVIRKLIEFYETGDLAIFDAYNILWVQDTLSEIDFTNGFIEVYGDPFGMRGSFQGMVSIIDHEASKRTNLISNNAQWFENHLPIDPAYRKPQAVGISARAINIAAVSGDNSPTPPLGVNLPNADWIRRDYGSKSVTISNVALAYDQANRQSGVLQEFAWDENELRLAVLYGALASNLHTDLHEITGHGSGQLKPGVADPNITLKNYASVIEEARADLVALYYLPDPKLVELQIMPSLEVGHTAYNQYIRNGLMQQLYRIQPGGQLEQTHMRNRQLISAWAMEKGLENNVIERRQRVGKTYFVINDHEQLRQIFGIQLKEIQRIKSEGDFQAAKHLVETYGVKVDQELLLEVHERYNRLNIAPYAAFINPVFTPVVRNDRIVDIKVDYPLDFLQQMMDYGQKYSFLPPYN